jgi:chaperonin GroES
MTLQPLGTKVIIKALEKEKMTASGIIIPDTAEKTRPMQGEVIAVGPGKTLDSGEVRPLSVVVGSTILFKKYGPDEVEIEGQSYLVADEADILAVVTH